MNINEKNYMDRRLQLTAMGDEIDPAKMDAFLDKRLKQAITNINYLKLVGGDTQQLMTELKQISKDTCTFGTIETFKQPKNLAIIGATALGLVGIGVYAGNKLKIKKKK